jgi:hypothetical protein
MRFSQMLVVLWISTGGATGVAGGVLQPEPEPGFPEAGSDPLGHVPHDESARLQLPPALRPYAAELAPGAVAAEPKTAGLEATGDCRGDPTAAAAIVWELARRAGGVTNRAIWSYSYWEREPAREPLPGDARGVTVLTLRAQRDDTHSVADDGDVWIYLPGRPPQNQQQRERAAKPPAYTWSCLGSADVSVQPRLASYLARDPNFGAASTGETWQLRAAWVIRFDPPDEVFPYHHYVFYIDQVTYEPLYGLAYDRQRRLRKVVVGDRPPVDVSVLERERKENDNGRRPTPIRESASGT